MYSRCRGWEKSQRRPKKKFKKHEAETKAVRFVNKPNRAGIFIEFIDNLCQFVAEEDEET